MGSIPSKHQEIESSSDAFLSRTNSVPEKNNRNATLSNMPWKLRLFSISQSRRCDPLQNVVLSDLESVQQGVEFSCEGNKGANNAHDSALNSVERVPCKDSNQAIHSDGTNVSLVNPFDATIGLRLLLNPGLESPSKVLASPTREISFKKSLLSNGSITIKSDEEFMLEPLLRQVSVPIIQEEVGVKDEELPNEGVKPDANILPIFDPCILANFEKAVEESWRISNVKSSKKVSSSSETSCSDEESCSEEDYMKCVSPRMHTPQLKTVSLCDRKALFSEVCPLTNEEKQWSREEYLNKFERVCPPGCESKIVIYFTSLRAVRKTFEDGFMLRLILKGLRVHVDERDVWMHSRFRQELTDVMGKAVSVPRLFILGRYIGGADEVEVLHEEGILARLVEGLPMNSKDICSICADVRFIPCSICRGSRKRISHMDLVECCKKCNENGLMMCPLCE